MALALVFPIVNIARSVLSFGSQHFSRDDNEVKYIIMHNGESSTGTNLSGRRNRRRRSRRESTWTSNCFPSHFPLQQAIECSLSSFALISDDHDVDRFRQQADASLTSYLHQVLETFQTQMSAGIPELGIPILDPLYIADMQLEDEHVQAHFHNVFIIGAAQFQITKLQVCLEKLELSLQLQFPQLRVEGGYQLSGRAVGILPLSGQGDFWIQGNLLQAEGKAALKNDSKNVLQIQHLLLNLNVKDIELHFGNLMGGGPLGSVVNGVVSALSTAIFERIKPRLLTTFSDSIRAKLNAELRHVNITKFIPGGLAHVMGSAAGRRRVTNANQYLDHVLDNAREQIREGGLDPLPLPDSDTLSEGQLFGLASVCRVGEAALSFTDDGTTLEATLGLANVLTCYRWNKKVMVHMGGRVSARARDVSVYIKIKQPSSSGSQPELQAFLIERIGPIYVRMTGLGPVSWLLEKGATLVSNLMRRRLAERLTGPVRRIIEINVGLTNTSTQHVW